MVQTLRKHILPLIIIVSLPVLVFAGVFLWQRSHAENRFVPELASYKERQLPSFPLIELKSREDYWNKVVDDDVLLVFATIGCAACEKELQAINESTGELKSGTKVYGVMFEDREAIDQYIQKYHINFPILIDDKARLLKELRLKYFPTNLLLKNGVIKEAWFGFAGNKDEFLKRIN